MLAILALAAVAVAAVAEDEPGNEAKSSLTDYEIMQYMASGSLSPQYVIGLDSNGEILLACQQMCTEEELRAQGIDVATSQLELLRVMSLLRRDEAGRWLTAFPVLDSARSDELRMRVKTLAHEAFGVLRPEIELLREALNEGDLAPHGYVVYFSYLLDGMAWGFLEEYNRVPRRRMSAARPFWAGEIWALENSREDWVGTSTYSERGLTLKVLQSRESRETTRALLDDRDAIRLALREYLESGRVEDRRAIEILNGLGILSAEGVFEVPVIDEIGRDPVFMATEQLTSKLVDWFLSELDFAALREDFGFRDEQQTVVITYHEFMWSLMSILEEEAIVDRPKGLDDSEATAGGIGELVLIVDRAHRAVRDDTDVEVGKSDEEGGD
jgi:hypothetical protein